MSALITLLCGLALTTPTDKQSLPPADTDTDQRPPSLIQKQKKMKPAQPHLL